MSEPALPIVCLVDDDSSVRRSLGRLLESAGFDVNAFSQPEAFLDHVSTHFVPVAILDIWMEKMTGMELLAHLRAQSPRTRAILITGHEDIAAEAVMRAGAFAFLLKPVDDDELLEAVEHAFARASPAPGR